MPTTVRRTYLDVRINGMFLANVLSARWSFGYDQRISEATVVVAGVPTTGGLRDVLGHVTGGFQHAEDYYANVTISAGAGTNNVLRFSGLLMQHDYSLWPRAVSLTCKGRLQLTSDFENSVGDGISLQNNQNLGGIDFTGQTDQQIVTTILNTAKMNVTTDVIGGGGIGTDFGGGFIDGTGTVLGTQINPDQAISNDLASGGPFVWKQGTTALSFIDELDKVCLGYRLYEGSGGVLYRAKISGHPNNAAVYTFTQGVDILEGKASRSIITAKNRVRVSGYDPGLGFGPITFALQSSNPFQPSDEWHTLEVSSQMIERAQDSDPGAGLVCADIAAWQMSEVNRVLVKASLTTPLDIVINPGETIMLLALDRLGTGEPLWVMRVDGQVDERGSFSQTLTCVGGGLADATPAPPFQLN